MPKIYTDLTSLRNELQQHSEQLTHEVIDNLVYTANLSEKVEIKDFAHRTILEYAPKHGVNSSSIHDVYMAFGKGELSGFSVPALNIRSITYDLAQEVFKLMITHSIGPVIFEIAISEQGYTKQSPSEYSSSVLGAAMKVGYKGPVFILGDHYQLRSDDFHDDKEAELRRIEQVIRSSIKAQFYNIDIDGSTLVNLSEVHEAVQQKDNYEVTAHFTRFIRKLQPENITIAIGGEIGHIGGKNSTPNEFRAFMDGYKKNIDMLTGLAKVSIQTGTHHGGVPQADGSLAKVELEADLHSTIGSIAREEYSLGGTVQHGASTLPEDQFHIFPEKGAVEVHLATQWQNIIYDTMSEDRKKGMYEWINQNLSEERNTEWTHEQFIYKLRKKAFGEFKYDMWTMPNDEKDRILEAFSAKCEFIFQKLRVFNTRQNVLKYFV